MLLVLICSFGLVLSSCSSNSTGPDTNGNNNGSGNGNGNNNGNTIGTEPTFSNVQQILEQSCGGASCHIGQRMSGVRLDGYTNVTESTGEQYGTLIVNKGNPAQSPIIDKIESNPQIGNRMPEGGTPLSGSRISQIREWIANGAENN